MLVCRTLCLMFNACMQFFQLELSETAFMAFGPSGVSRWIIVTYRIDCALV